MMLLECSNFSIFLINDTLETPTTYLQIIHGIPVYCGTLVENSCHRSVEAKPSMEVTPSGLQFISSVYSRNALYAQPQWLAQHWLPRREKGLLTSSLLHHKVFWVKPGNWKEAQECHWALVLIKYWMALLSSGGNKEFSQGWHQMWLHHMFWMESTRIVGDSRNKLAIITSFPNRSACFTD